MGTVTVDATRYAVTIQERSSNARRSATMPGSAVATIVWSSAASSVASMIPAYAASTARRDAGTGVATSGPSLRNPAVARGRHDELVRVAARLLAGEVGDRPGDLLLVGERV